MVLVGGHLDFPRTEEMKAPMAEVWTKLASKLTSVRIIEAKDEKEPIEIASKEFKVAPNRLIAQPTK